MKGLLSMYSMTSPVSGRISSRLSKPPKLDPTPNEGMDPSGIFFVKSKRTVHVLLVKFYLSFTLILSRFYPDKITIKPE